MTKAIKEKLIGWESLVAIHPGEFLVDVLEEFSMSQSDLAERIGLSKKAVNEIIKGKNPITKRTAYCLHKVFPFSKEYWINLQNRYESDKVRLEEKEVLKKKRLYISKILLKLIKSLPRLAM